MSERMLVSGTNDNSSNAEIDYEEVHNRIEKARKESLEFLHMELTSCF